MRIYYGWINVGITMVILMLLVGCVSNAFGLFVLPVSQDLGLSRADVNTGYILTIFGGAFAAPFIGRLIDIYPVRRIMLVSAIMFAVGMIIVGLSRSVPLSAAMLVGPVALGMGGVGTIGSLTIVARWFTAQRGRAMAISMMGMSLGTIVLTPLVGLSLSMLGWRHTLVLLGAIMGVIFLLAVFFMRERPAPGESEAGMANASPASVSAAAEPAEKPKKTLEILKMPLFWVPSLAAALALGVAQAIAITIVPMAQEAGISITQAATLMSMVGASSIAGKFLLVWAGDKVSRSLSLALMSTATALVSLLLIFANTYGMLLASSALLGLAVGAITPALLALLADNVGAASFGSANGIAMLMTSFSGAVAMRSAGEFYDRTGGYTLMFTVFVIVSIVSLLMLLLCLRLEHGRAAALAT